MLETVESVYEQYEHFQQLLRQPPILYLDWIKLLRQKYRTLDLNRNLTNFSLEYFTRPPLDPEIFKVKAQYVREVGIRIASKFRYNKLGQLARTFGFSLKDLLNLNEFEIEAWLLTANHLIDNEKQDQKSFLEGLSKQMIPSETRPANIQKPNFIM